MGRTIPKAVITSPDQTVVYAKMSYKQLKSSSSYSITSKKVKAAQKGDIPKPDATMIPMWPLKNSDRYYTGSFIELKENKILVLKMKDGGRQSNIPISKLSEGSQAYARILQEKQTAAQSTTEDSAPKYTVEAWKSSKGGKVIQGTFVSLEGGKITLKKENDETVTFGIELLSEKSQKRAQELSGE